MMVRSGTRLLLARTKWPVKKILIATMFLASMASAAPRNKIESIPTFRDEGRNPILFSISCTTTSWTVIASSDPIRRSILIQADPGNTLTVCVSTTTNSSDSCTSARPGPKLIAASALTDYTPIQWTCRAASSASVSAAAVSGYSTRDKGDYGYQTSPSLQ